MSKDNKFYIVILAGGSGTRFWPLSRQEEPKQFLNIAGNLSLLQQTLRRIESIVHSENVYIVTNERYKPQVTSQLKNFKIPSENILLEPQGKNTAPAIAWVAARIYRRDKEAVMAILPSDHLILKEKSFLTVLNQTRILAKEGFLVTMGLVPTRPETGYGYLKTKKIKWQGEIIWKVEKFTEKPPLKTAQRFVKSKNYLWNSGIFIWKVSVILDEFKRFLPDLFMAFRDRDDAAYAKKIWPKLPSISIDYGILEKSDKGATVPASDIGWLDLGSWQALAEVLPKDQNTNALKGDIFQIDCKQTLIQGNKRFIAAIGLENVTVVDTPDALLICRTDLSQKIKEVVDFLKKHNRPEAIRSPKS